MITGRHTNIGGHRLYVRSAGLHHRGTPALLLHGLVVSSAAVLPTARVLAHTRPVIAPDLPGFGRSPHPDARLPLASLAHLAERVIRRHGERAVVVANSFGCHLAVELAVRHPQCVHALILTGPTATPPSSGLPALLSRWALTALREPIDVVPLALRDLRRSGIRHAAAHLREARRYPLARRLAQVNAPTLVVRGQQDHLAPARWSRHLTSIARRGRLVHVPGAHMLPYERPRLVADLVDMTDAVAPPGRRRAGTVGYDRPAGC